MVTDFGINPNELPRAFRRELAKRDTSVPFFDPAPTLKGIKAFYQDIQTLKDPQQLLRCRPDQEEAPRGIGQRIAALFNIKRSQPIDTTYADKLEKLPVCAQTALVKEFFDRLDFGHLFDKPLDWTRQKVERWSDALSRPHMSFDSLLSDMESAPDIVYGKHELSWQYQQIKQDKAAMAEIKDTFDERGQVAALEKMSELSGMKLPMTEALKDRYNGEAYIAAFQALPEKWQRYFETQDKNSPAFMPEEEIQEALEKYKASVSAEISSRKSASVSPQSPTDDIEYEDIVEIHTDEPGIPAIILDAIPERDKRENGVEAKEKWAVVDAEELGVHDLFVDQGKIEYDYESDDEENEVENEDEVVGQSRGFHR